MTRIESAQSTIVGPFPTDVMPIRDDFDDVADGFTTVANAEIAHVSIVSVVRVAAVFWMCAGATFFMTLFALWLTLNTTGAITNFEHFVEDATGLKSFHVMSGTLLAGVGIGVVVFVCIATVITVAMALFYNALAAIVGGVQVRAVVPSVTVASTPPRKGLAGR